MEIYHAAPTNSLNPDSQSKNLNQESKNKKILGKKNKLVSWDKLAAFKVDGLLLSGLSEEVQNVIETLRAELEQAKGRESYYRNLTESHAFLELHSRRFFLKKLSDIISRTEHFSAPPILLILSGQNSDRIRLKHGRLGLETVLKQFVNNIKNIIDQTDIFGSLGGHDFGLILLDCSPNKVSDFVEMMEQRIQAQEFYFDSQKIKLDVKIGFKALSTDDNWEEALNTIDKSLYEQINQ